MRRRFILLTTIILLLLAVIPVAAFAVDEPEYHYIVEDATLSLTGDVVGEIILPHSWYVKYLSDPSSQDFKTVEYNGVIGKVAKSMLSKKTTVTPVGDYYFTYIGTITKKSSAPLVIYSNLETLASVSVKEPLSIEFIAFSSTEDNCFLARVSKSQNEKIIGFIYTDSVTANPAITVTESTESVNPDLSTGDETLTPPTTDVKPQSPTNDVLKIILITAVCILSVVVVFLIFKPTKNSKKRDDYYDRD